MAAPDLVETRDEDGFTPLHLAVIAGNTQLVTFLLANGADVRAVDNEKHTVVHWATVCGETTALRAVLAAGAPVSTPDVHGGYPLHYAAQMCGGDKDQELGVQVLHTLLGHKDIDVSVEDGDKRQPLLWAASAGSTKAILALSRAGAQIESADRDGLTALHCAASRGHTDCIDTLLTLCGASPDVIDSNGCTALHYAVTLGHADATALLLAHGADPNRQDRKGRSPAHCGCAKGQFETVKLIGARGANLWLRNARGDIPLHEAAASGRRELVMWLLGMRPSQVNGRNNDGRTPLHMAALNDNVDMCKILLDSGALINPVLRTSKNIFMTPLDCALQRGFRSTAKYLQLHGGVPASRVSTQNETQVSSSVNLQIRDDVTFWGDTSSNSEDDKKDSKTSARKIHRKKSSYRSRKKTELISGSDSDLPKKRAERKDSFKANGFKRSTKVAATNTSASAIPKESPRKSSSSRIDYSNEIIINGKTEINIHHKKEITVETDSDQLSPRKVQIQENISFPSNEKQASDKERRPRSAKFSKLSREKSATESANALDTKDTKQIIIDSPELTKSGSVLGQSTGTSDDTMDTVIDTYKLKAEVRETTRERMLELPEISNTSEEIEEPHELVVEASVHPMPKDYEDEAKVEQVVTSKETEKSTSEYIKDTSEEKDRDTTKAEKTVQPEETVKRKVIEIVDKEMNELSEKMSPKEEVSMLSEQKLEEKKENLDNLTQGSKDKTLVTELETSKLIEASAEQINEIAQTILTTGDKKDVDEDIETTVMEEKNKINEELKQQHKTKLNQRTKLKRQPTSAEEFNESLDEEVTVKDKKTPVSKVERKLRDKKKILKEDENTQTAIPKPEAKQKKTKSFKKIREDVKISEMKTKRADEEYYSSSSEFPSDSLEQPNKTHKSFKVLSDKEARELEKQAKLKSRKGQEENKPRSKSEETKSKKQLREERRVKISKIPTPTFQMPLSKSERHLDRLGDDRRIQSSMDTKVPSLPNIHDSCRERFLREPFRPDSNLSAPILPSVYSDNERDSMSDLEEDPRSSPTKRKKVKKRPRPRRRESKSAGSDYESSNLIDSGFEPSPRSSRIPKWRNMSNRGVNMTSVTRSIQNNIRRYHLERKIFQHLLELKRSQIRAGQHNETMLVKRAIDQYNQSCSSTVGAGRYIPDDFTFKSFEKFLYESLRKLQKIDVEYLKGLPTSSEHVNPLLCTQSTHRCMHATHAYTGIPCAAYLPKIDHHNIPKIGFGNSTVCRPGGVLPSINKKKTVTLELSHGADKQVISLPTDKLDQNKRYYVTFTVKGQDKGSSDDTANGNGHIHSKSV
ncbi:ankyrin repeat domain-containing protein 12 isoform X2 [Sitophilus oryzae]|nr:ankyrin repeat domain-containing protein 12 isoform X2 [Sitophilus oryzae]